MKKIVLVFFIHIVSYSQTVVSGKVSNADGLPLTSVNIILKNNKNAIIAYTFSDDKGLYSLSFMFDGELSLYFSSLSFKPISVHIDGSEKEIHRDIVLQTHEIQLSEVIIKTKTPMILKKDTIVYSVKSFIQGDEVVIEDLLKKIPGINVNSEGTIKIGNREIEKIMIDGDDFFEKGYKILSKNMPPDQINSIEILQNYSNNKLLKDIEDSDNVALNLVLKEDAKRKWFGNFSFGYDVLFNNHYSFDNYLMNFGKKNKYIFFSNFNNIGSDATGNIQHLIKPTNNSESVNIGDNQSAYSLLNFDTFTPNLKSDRTNINKTGLTSLNAIFNLSKKLKIKTLVFLNWDENDFFKKNDQIFSTNNINFINTESFKLKKKERVNFGKIDFSYNISKNKLLESTIKYNNGITNGKSFLTFNEFSSTENLQFSNTFFDQKLKYSNRFDDKKIFFISGRFIDEKSPQSYKTNHFYYHELFPDFSNVNNIKQQSKNQMQFAGIEAHFLDRKISGNLFELQFGNQYRKDKLKTTFTLFDDVTILDNPIGYQNNMIYHVNDIFIKSKYRYKLNNFDVIGKLGFHQLFNSLNFTHYEKNQHSFYINPSIGLDWKINNKNKIVGLFSYNTTNTTLLDVFNGFVLTNSRSFSKGMGFFNQLNSSTAHVNYQFGNWNDRFFVNTFVLYNKNFDFLSNNILISQNYTLSKKIIIKDRELLSVSSSLDYYFKNISSNFKLKLGYSKSNYKNVINDSDFRFVKSNNYNYGFGLRSGFKGFFNYYISTKWLSKQINVSTTHNSFTDNTVFLDLSFVCNDRFDFQLQTERYFFGNLDKNNTYYFLDFDANYKIIKNKVSLSIIGNNLFNTERFKIFSISDIGTSTTEYKLLERFVLLKIKYRL